MRNAPSVMYPVGRCAFHVQALLVLAAIVAAALLGWRVGSAVDTRLWLATLLGAVLWLAWGLRAWWRSPVGRLHWDAQASNLPSVEVGAWFWHGGATLDPRPLQRLEPALDLQRLMLLRLHAPKSVPRWVWVQQTSDPARWLDLRRALQRGSA
jgi:hypothetical protein